MKTLARGLLVLALIPLGAAHAVDAEGVLGGAIGGGAGAAIGSEVGGRNGAIVGSAVGAAIGTAIMADDERPDSRPEVVYVEKDHPNHPPGRALGHYKRHKHRHW